MLGGANVARLKNEIIRKKLKFRILRILISDSVGIRTRGLLLRRQLLYPAELRNQPFSDF